MKFGTFFELSVPRLSTPEDEHQGFMNAFEQARLADELGFSTVRAVEHHFLEAYSHSSARPTALTRTNSASIQQKDCHRNPNRRPKARLFLLSFAATLARECGDDEPNPDGDVTSGGYYSSHCQDI